ncbi:hypothetical protein HYALB_00005987 [Hymenoscyphus albidus]|uniref:Uncharacterized protein n=1 Tax=Hymenoscyphus albidus TaxID=595503 RepID=A0A9N9LJA7_9HELO|nr:hypothetical protein HYALB_00005987 [Hymenoscyphus albidus]
MPRVNARLAVNNFETPMTKEFARTRENLQYLREQCEVNGSLIVKRWKKKSSEKRKVLLSLVDPDIYPNQSDIRFSQEFVGLPNIKKYCQLQIPYAVPEEHRQGNVRRPYRNICLLPYINFQGLKDNPAKLLHLIYNRINYSPQQWAPFDNYLLDKQWNIGTFATVYNRSCIIMHGTDYGKLVPWNEDLAHTWDIVGFPRANLVLEAQMRLSEFLKGVVERLLDGNFISEENSGGSFDQAFASGLKKVTGLSNCVEFASKLINQPFSAPPSFNISSFRSIAESQKNFHADHLWLLQTDPLSMRHYAANLLNGVQRENMRRPQKMYTISIMLMRNLTSLQIWEWIEEEVHKLGAFDGQIKPGIVLHPTYAHTLARLTALLSHLIRDVAGFCLVAIQTRPGFRSEYRKEITYFSRSVEKVVHHRKDDLTTIELYEKDPLQFCLLALTEASMVSLNDTSIDALYTVSHEPVEILAILEDHLTKAREQDASRLDEVLYASFSDLSALHQILFMVRLHQPRVPTLSIEEAMKENEGKAWRYLRAGYLEQDCLGPCNVETEDERIQACKLLGNFMEKFLNTEKPTGSKVNQKWLDQDKTQRAACSQFWAQIRKRYRQILELIKLGEDDISNDLMVLSADLDLKQISEVQNEHEEIMKAIVSVRTQKVEKNNTPKAEPIQTQWGTDAQLENKPSAFGVKVKVKTHTDNFAMEALVECTENNEEEALPAIKVAVSKRALDTLQALYQKPSFEERTKSIDWVSFVHAMNEAGFIARQIHGSEYSFEPASTFPWYGRGKIVFHKPHPEPKYEAWKLLGIGKQMKKWFGWDADTFELLRGKREG